MSTSSAIVHFVIQSDGLSVTREKDVVSAVTAIELKWSICYYDSDA